MHSIFISGAAQGIGAATAIFFYQQGFKVGIYDLNAVQAQKLAQKLGPNAKAGLLDVCNVQHWQNALAEFTAWAGELNILVNNAGILFSGPFEDTPLEAHHKTIDINIKGVINGCHTALPYLRQASYARVINLSSASAIYGQPDLASYAASKFAVRGLTEGLDIEWKKYGIRVLDIMPLFVQTAMVKGMNAASIHNMGVNLSAEDVAAQIYKTAYVKDSIFGSTHYPVGLKTKVMMTLSNVSPQFVNRLGNLWISKR